MAAAASVAAAGPGAPAPEQQQTTELTRILMDSQSAVEATRRAAELKLRNAEENNFAAYVTELARELSSENRPEAVRQLAGIVLKNTVSGTDPLIDKMKQSKWLTLDPNVATGIREMVLLTLTSSSEHARSAACQAIAKFGRLDLPRKEWSQLLPALGELIINAESTSERRRAAVTAVGYLCEDVSILGQDLSEDLLNSEQRNLILTMVTHALRNPDPEVVIAACKSFYHVLLFARENMAQETERDFIFQVVAQCLKHEDLRIQLGAWECTLQLVTEFYQYLDKYVGGFGEHSIATIQIGMRAVEEKSLSDEAKLKIEAVALAALEFWSSLSDLEFLLEQELADPLAGASAAAPARNGNTPPAHSNFIQHASGVLLPVLFEAMTKQADNGGASLDMDEWRLSMAAGMCVGLCAQLLRDSILEPALDFINVNFSDKDWRRREAAVLAYGSIMEGPSSEKLEPLVEQSFEHLCNALVDESVAVRDTTAWSIGRIASFHIRCIARLLGSPSQPGLLNLLLEKLSDEPRVAAYVCYAIHEIARNIRQCDVCTVDDNNITHTPIDPFFPSISSALLQVAQKPNGAESGLRASAFESLGEVVMNVGGTDCYHTMEAILGQLVQWLSASFHTDENEEVTQLRGSICGCLSYLTDRLGSKLAGSPVCGQLFHLYIRVIEVSVTSSSTARTTGVPVEVAEGDSFRGGVEERAKVGAEEDAALALGMLVRHAGASLEPVVATLTEVVMRGLKNPQDARFCRSCIGIVCEMAASLDFKNPVYRSCTSSLISELLNLLRNQAANVSLKPPLMTALGDIAVGMGEEFIPYLDSFFELLEQAASMSLSDGPATDVWVEYFHTLRESVLESLVGVVNCLRDAKRLDLFKTHVNRWLVFVESIVLDESASPALVSKSVEVMGDLVTSYGAELVAHVISKPFYKAMLNRADNSDDKDLVQRVSFLKCAVARCNW